MANPEHVKILKQGVEVWNQWREENREVPYLNGADLRSADLRGIDLSYANLLNANLSCADLSDALLSIAFLGKANLREANLRGANLNKANLREANLWEANLKKAYLRHANLEEAYLRGTNLNYANLCNVNFNGVDLKRANLNNAECSSTIFANLDLSESLDLEILVHSGPSIIGIDTLYKSKGKIPEVFLRGCGVPDQMIEYAKSLTANPIEYYSCFISYSHKNEAFAKRLHADLQTHNVRCWYAPHDMKIGDKIRPTIDDSIRIHDKLLLILSEHSVQSDWVEHEVEHALDLEKERKKNVLFPVRVDEAVMDSKTGWAGNVRRQRHIGDFTRWKDHDAYSKAFERLLRDLKAG